MANVQDHKKNCCVLIPYWISNQVSRNGLNLDIVMKLDELLKICSMDDVASMYLLNTTLSSPFVGDGIADNNFGNITTIWLKRNPELERNVCIYTKCLTEEAVYSRLSVSDLSTDTPETTDFEFHHLTVDGNIAGGLGYVLPKGIWFGKNHDKLSQGLVKQYLKKSFGFSKFDQLAKDGAFSKYLSGIWNEELAAA